MDNDTVTQSKAVEVPDGFTQVPFAAPGIGMTVDSVNDAFGSGKQYATDIPEGFEPEETGKQFWFQGIMDRAVGGEGNIAENSLFGFTEWLSAGYSVEEADQLKNDYIKRLQDVPGNLYRAGKYVGSRMIDQMEEDFKAADNFVKNPVGALSDYIKNSFKQESDQERAIKAQEAKASLKEMGEELGPGAMDVIDFTFGPFIKLSRILQAVALPDKGEKRSEQVVRDVLRDPGPNPMAKRIFERIDDPNDPIGMTATKMTISAVTGAVSDVMSFNPSGVWRGIKNLPKSTQESYRAVVLNEVDKDLNLWLRDSLKQGIKSRKSTAVREAGSTKELVTAEQIDLMTAKHVEELAKVDPYFGAYLKSKVDQFSPLNKLRNNRGTIEFAPEPQRLKSSLKAVINSTKMPGVVAAKQALGTLKNAGIKPEELEYSGIEDYLKTKDKFTKEELLDYVEENKVKIEVVSKSDETRKWTIEDIKYQGVVKVGNVDFHRIEVPDNVYQLPVTQYQTKAQAIERALQKGTGYDKTKFNRPDLILPGGTNYQEHLVKIPVKYSDTLKAVREENSKLNSEAMEVTRRQRSGEISAEEVDKLVRDINSRRPISNPKEHPKLFTSSHFPNDPNTVVHIRTNDRVSADGKKVLFVEEIQSDWHLAGKQQGYVGTLAKYDIEKLDHLRKRLSEVEKEQIANDKEIRYLRDLVGASKEQNLEHRKRKARHVELNQSFKEIQDLIGIVEKPLGGVPDAPFKKSYNELAIKQVIEIAVKNGYDQVAFISGKQTADRYDLSKKVNKVELVYRKDGSKTIVATTSSGDRIIHKKISDESEITQIIGKEPAKRLLESEIEAFEGGVSSRKISGEELKVGGEWAFTLYDKIIPKAADKYVSQWGSKVKDITIPRKKGSTYYQDEELTQKGFDITPQMRQEVSTVGQPLFGNRVPGSLADKLKSKKGFSGRKEQDPLPDDFEGKPQIFDMVGTTSEADALKEVSDFVASHELTAQKITDPEGNIKAIVNPGMPEGLKGYTTKQIEAVVNNVASGKKLTPLQEDLKNVMLGIADDMGIDVIDPNAAKVGDGVDLYTYDGKDIKGKIAAINVNEGNQTIYSVQVKGEAEARKMLREGFEITSSAEKPTTATPPAASTPKPPDKKPPVSKPRPGKPEEDAFNAAYEEVKDIWFGEKDVGVHKSQVQKRMLQKDLKAIDKDKAIEYDKAIQIYLDTKRNPGNVKKYYDKLTDEQKAIVDLSKNLPKEVKAVADKIRESYNEVGLNALENDVIKNVLDNYVARVWEIEGKPGMENFRKFGVTTRHAKQRKFDTIIEGWASGFELKVQGATSNLQILKEEIIKTIADKKFVESLKKLKTIDGQPLLSTDQLEGYKVVEHPNFKSWKFAGNIEEGKTYGKNFFTTNDGMVFERRDLFAPKEQADNINRVLGVSKLKGKPVIDFLTKYNAIAKAWILQSSFFHHLAFMRSYYLGTNHKRFAEMNVIDAYKEGIKAIESADPIVELLVKKGLTLGIRQDWNEELLQEKTGIGVLLDKWKVSKDVKDKILDLRQKQADFLFGELGAGLKAKSGLIEFRNLTKKYPNKDPEEIAEMVANLINDDFGGLHLGRLDRDPTIQHIFRLFALAPDWTESNIRSMVKAFTKKGAEGAFYRQFWAGIFTKAALLTITANVLLNGKDAIDNAERAWQEGNLKWTGVDITNIYKALGGKTSNRKYFSIIGHFKDPVKFILHPVRSAQHKGSVLYRFFHEALTGVDWASRRFTTFTELIGNDKEKGVYKTTSKDKYKKGDPKYGKLKGQTVTWTPGKRGPLEYSQLPSFALSQVKGWQPVQIQNLISWMAGEMEGFDAIMNSMGLGVTSTYGGDEKPIANLKKKYKIEDRIDSDDTIKKLMKMGKEDFDLYMSQYAEKTIKRVNKKIKRRIK